jgi:hypothetical protein
MPIDNVFAVFVEILDGHRPQLVESASNLHAIISIGIASILRPHEEAVGLLIHPEEIGGVVMG